MKVKIFGRSTAAMLLAVLLFVQTTANVNAESYGTGLSSSASIDIDGIDREAPVISYYVRVASSEELIINMRFSDTLSGLNSLVTPSGIVELSGHEGIYTYSVFRNGEYFFTLVDNADNQTELAVDIDYIMPDYPGVGNANPSTGLPPNNSEDSGDDNTGSGGQQWREFFISGLLADIFAGGVFALGVTLYFLLFGRKRKGQDIIGSND